MEQKRESAGGRPKQGSISATQKKTAPKPPVKKAPAKAAASGSRAKGTPLKEIPAVSAPSVKKPPVKKPLTPEEKKRREEKRKEEELRRREAARERARRSLRRRQLFLLSFAVSFIWVIFYCAWVAIDIAVRADGKEEAQPVLLFTQGEKKEDKSYPVEEVFFEGAHYLPVTALEPYMEVSQFGDHRTRSLSLEKTGDYATFYPGSANGVINGQKISLRNNVLVIGDDLYLPLEFYHEVMNCFELEDSPALAAWVLTYTGEEPSFCYRAMEETAAQDPALAPEPKPEEEENPEEPDQSESSQG